MDGELNTGTPQNTLVEYSPIEAALNQFRGRYAGRVYDVTTAAGMKDARAARMEVRSARTELERVRKSIKEPALRRCQLIDSEAKRITAALVEIEDPIDECIKAEETRKEREKAEREAAEKRRVDEIQARITALHRAPNWGDGSAEIKQAIAEIEAVTITEDKFFEFGLAAEAVKFNTLSTLRAALATVLEKEQAAELARIAREAEEQRIAAERAEHERVMAEEKAARDAAAAEQRANLEAARAEQEAILAAERAELDARKAAEKAERERVMAEEKAARDAAAAEQRANLEAARAEQEAILAAERAELETRKAAERAERERVEAEMEAERKKFEDERRAAQEAEFKRLCAEQAAEVERCHRELVLAARCGSDREALEAIAAILKDDSKHEDEKLEDIRLVIEANL